MNELTVYDRAADPQSFIDSVGRDIVKSGMFGCQTEHQGRVLALECAVRRMPPLTLSQRFHLIKGKLSMKADAMLAGLRQVGGKYEVVSHTPDLAAIEISRDRKKQMFSLSWEDAQKEPFVYEGKEADVVAKLVAGSKPQMKAKYATPRSRMQMLWARVVSDSVRVMAPEVAAGFYTPEETHDFTPGAGSVPEEPVAEEHDEADDVIDVEPASDGNGEQGSSSGSLVHDEANTPTEPEPEPEPSPEDVEIEAAEAAAEAGIAAGNKAAEKLTATPVEGSAIPADKSCSAEQIDSVKSLYDVLRPHGFSDEGLRGMLSTLGAERVSKLSAGGIEKLIGRMMQSREVFDLADELKMGADTLGSVVRKAGVNAVWQLSDELLPQLIARLKKELSKRKAAAKN